MDSREFLNLLLYNCSALKCDLLLVHTRSIKLIYEANEKLFISRIDYCNLKREVSGSRKVLEKILHSLECPWNDNTFLGLSLEG